MKNKYNYALSILSLLFIIIFGNTKAQVISITFSPDIIIYASSQPYSFDFIGDGLIDFYFLVQDFSLYTTISGFPSTYEGSGALMGCQSA